MRMKSDDPYEVAAMTDTDDGATDFRTMSEPRRAYWADRFIGCCDLGAHQCMTWSADELGTLLIAPGWISSPDGTNSYEPYTVQLWRLLPLFDRSRALVGRVPSMVDLKDGFLTINGQLIGTTVDAWVCFLRTPQEV